MKKEKTNHSEIAIKHIAKMVTNRFNGKEKSSSFNISYKRLRASAGKTMLESIFKRIETSNVVIFDISEDNPNVFLELGIAIALTKNNYNISVYLIKERKEKGSLLAELPSDLQGYFISEYIVNAKGEVSFQDNNSLRMSIESDVKEFYASRSSRDFKIDEINYQ
jgi:predicted DNA binding protein